MELLLEAVDVAGPLRWRWLLRDEETGNPIADHRVNLVPVPDEVARFRDLYEYVRSYAAPDRRTQDGARFVREAGIWGGRQLLGERVGAAIVAEAPVTVRVTVPATLDPVLLWPLELAHADGKPLAARGDVTFVYDIGGPDGRKAPVGAALRMLAVFSLPSRTSMLALRRERYALSRLIRRIAARERATVQLRVVQYGVTRRRLAEIADDGDGWDVLHLSGHGTGGVFAMERDDGSRDALSAGDLVRLLRPVRRRVKLAVVSACESAADTTAETLRLIGLAEQADAVAAEAGEGTATQVPGLARALVRELDCAVVAMRYPVTDEFSMAFGNAFYEHLFSRRQPVDVSAARAVARAAGAAATAARPALSLATPGVFGARASGLTLPVPRGRPDLDPAERPMAYFPGEPERFVGRAAAMAEASAALAPGSGRTAVLLHGMAGAGKSACALELAYRHAENFAAAAFWQAPTREEEWPGALADLANRLELQLGDYGFTMASHIGTTADLERFLPRLRQVMADGGVLLVLDNLETLLTPEGTWRDPRWERLVSALTGHGGESRVILTSRTAPAELEAEVADGLPPVVTLRVHALPLAEATALARELPHLRELLHVDAGLAGAPDAAEADRERVRRVLRVVQGHPKLMELADAAAADRDRLDARLAATEAAGQGLDVFFRDGLSTLGPEQFLGALNEWTTDALGVLAPATRLMAEFVACLEDSDRRPRLIAATWGELWHRLDRPDDPPEPQPLLAALTAAALAEADTVRPAGAGNEPVPVAYRMHPGVAAAIVAAVDPGVREATDVVLAAYWKAAADRARQKESGEDSRQVAHAALAAAPYLMRRGDWDTASELLEQAIVRDRSPGNKQEVLPALRRIAAATGELRDIALLARTLGDVDPAEAERLLRETLADADRTGDYRSASSIAGALADLLVEGGRPREALAAAGQEADYTRRAGLGPWTELGGEGRRLQVLAIMGEYQQVLAEVTRLRPRMAELPEHSGADETIMPWNVRESILGVGQLAAEALEDWQQALDLNAEIVSAQRRRDADAHDVARTLYNSAVVLIRLERLAEAERVLVHCQQVFEDSADTSALAAVLRARAQLETVRGRLHAGADFQRAALRLSYVGLQPREAGLSHYVLATFLWRLRSDRAEQRAHRLAGGILCQLTGMADDLAINSRSLATELHEDDGAERLPSTVADIVATAELTEGVRLRELLAILAPDPQAVADALTQVLAAAAALPPEEREPGITEFLREYEDVIAEVVDACRNGQTETAEFQEFLDEGADNPDWAPLFATLRRIAAGERGEALLAGLNVFDAAFIHETLRRLEQEQ